MELGAEQVLLRGMIDRIERLKEAEFEAMHNLSKGQGTPAFPKRAEINSDNDTDLGDGIEFLKQALLKFTSAKTRGVKQ